MDFYIDVILPLPLDNLFTYKVNEQEADFLNPGARVAVPFGKTKIYTGIVSKIHNEKPLVYEAKPIEQILDKTSIVTITQLEFWFWVSRYYMCTVGEVMKAALPGAFLLESETLIELDKTKNCNWKSSIKFTYGIKLSMNSKNGKRAIKKLKATALALVEKVPLIIPPEYISQRSKNVRPSKPGKITLDV